ncbi:MAG: hypothetical protein IIV97_01490, partial [Oscillospiraceae bacterium]|nr:hypothetical protein [Oscillospiraceae bacterium]
SENVPTFSVSSDGLSLQLRDEKGRWFDSAHTTALVALLSFESGKSQLAVPPDSPSVLEQIAAEYNGKILRIGRDHGARELFLSQNILCDAFGCAIFISSELSKRKSPLSSLMNLIPDFTLISREISVSGDRSQLLLRLSDMCEGFHRENSGSLRVCADGGWVNILPARKRRFLKITGEGMNEEIASELCNIFVEKTIKADFPHDK